MNKATLFNNKGDIIEDIELSDILFDREPNMFVVQQYVETYLANQSQGTSSTKNRSEVRGGGKKPWRQKGTGRARAGSITSPIWRHGGITFGPQPFKRRKKLPKKMRWLAFASVLSDKARENRIYVIENVDFEITKTSTVANLLKVLELSEDTNKVIITKEPNETLMQIGRNVANMQISFTNEICTYDLLKADYVIFVKDALEDIEGFYNDKLKDIGE